MLSKARFRNYRALEKLDLDLGPLVALIGPNGVGKSAVLRGLDFILGSRWPGLSRLNIPQDFTAFNDQAELLIELSFDPPLESPKDRVGNEHEIHSLRVHCAPYKFETLRREAYKLAKQSLPTATKRVRR